MNLVVGYGNPLRGDDGAGWRVADLVAHETETRPWLAVTVRQLHQLLPEVAQWLSETEQVAVLVDTAVSATLPPGTIQCREVQPAPYQPTAFSHQLSPSVVLGMAQALYGRAPRVFLVTVVGGEFGYVEGVSTAVEQVLPALVQQVIQLLSEQYEARSES